MTILLEILFGLLPGGTGWLDAMESEDVGTSTEVHGTIDPSG